MEKVRLFGFILLGVSSIICSAYGLSVPRSGRSSDHQDRGRGHTSGNGVPIALGHQGKTWGGEIKMPVVTSEKIEGKNIVETLGLVKGNIVRAKWIRKDILAALRNIVGGELREYTEMLSEAREEAEKLGADAIISGAAELLAYGTAVKLE